MSPPGPASTRRSSHRNAIVVLLLLLAGWVAVNISNSTAMESNTHVFSPAPDGTERAGMAEQLEGRRFIDYIWDNHHHSSSSSSNSNDNNVVVGGDAPPAAVDGATGSASSPLMDLSQIFSKRGQLLLHPFGRGSSSSSSSSSSSEEEEEEEVDPVVTIRRSTPTAASSSVASHHQPPAFSSSSSLPPPPPPPLSPRSPYAIATTAAHQQQSLSPQQLHRHQHHLRTSPHDPVRTAVPPLPQRPLHAPSSVAARRDPTSICTDIVGMGISHCVSAATQLRGIWRVHLVPQDAPSKGFRFHHLIDQGLNLHRGVRRVDSPDDADVILYLPTSTRDIPVRNETVPGFSGGAVRNANLARLVVLDEGDGPGHIRKVKSGEYLAYFKRSWVRKTDGAFASNPPRFKDRYFPMTYSVSNNYTSGVFDTMRTHDVVCTLRLNKKQPARARGLGWVGAVVGEMGVANSSIVGEVNHAQRRTISRAYLDHNRNAKIVVTCNPSFWDGDFRTWEAMASGALVFVDQMHVPVAHPLVDGVHLIIYDNHDEGTFRAKLRYYLERPLEAQKIALRGYLHALRYHRTISRMDYILRSAHVAYEARVGKPPPAGRPPRYNFTAQQIVNDERFLMRLPGHRRTTPIAV